MASGNNISKIFAGVLRTIGDTLIVVTYVYQYTKGVNKCLKDGSFLKFEYYI
jgi:hypothetical protein